MELPSGVGFGANNLCVKLWSDFNWPPASGWWDWSPGLVGPWENTEFKKKLPIKYCSIN